jgi:hypothetical protein
MNLNAATVLDPVFHFLDWIITEWGVYLFHSHEGETIGVGIVYS